MKAKAEAGGHKSLLIVGAYGVVGEQVVALLREHDPEIDLWVAGRSQQKAAELAHRYGCAGAMQIDLDHRDPLERREQLPDAVLALANDAMDNLLRACCLRGIPYIDVTRWTERMVSSLEMLQHHPLRAPVILSSAWMAGVVATVVAALAPQFEEMEKVEFDVLFALKDKAGPNSIEYVDRLKVPFMVRQNGRDVRKLPFTDARKTRFTGDRIFETVRFDTPDQYTLPRNFGIPTVAGRVGYDDTRTMGFMKFMLRSGLWTVLSLPAFASIRRSLLFNPGPGAAHEVQLSICGRGKDGVRLERITTISDALGQTHMTAAGAVLQVERVFGLKGFAPLTPGLSFPEAVSETQLAIGRLEALGVEIRPAVADPQ